MFVRTALVALCLVVSACQPQPSDSTASAADARAVVEASGLPLAETAAAIEALKQVVGELSADGTKPATLAEAVATLNATRAVVTAGRQCSAELEGLRAEATALRAVSGAGLTETATALSTLCSAIGASTLDEALSSLDAQRAALKADAPTLSDAVSAVASKLGGSGTVLERASAVMGANLQCTSSLASLRAEADTVGAASGASLTETATSITTLRAFTGAATLAQALTSLEAQRTALKPDAPTLSAAVTAIAATLGGQGAVYDRAVALRSTATQCTSDLEGLRAQATALSAASGASLEATTASLLTLRTFTGTASLDLSLTALDGQRAAIKSDAATLSAAVNAVAAILGGSGTLAQRASTAMSASTQCTTDFQRLTTEADALSAASGASLVATTASVSTLRSMMGTTTLGQAVSAVDAQRAALKADAANLADAVSAVGLALGGTGTVFERAATANGTCGQCASELVSLRADVAALSDVSGASLAVTANSLTTLRTVTGTSSLADALASVDAQRAALKVDATTLQGAVDAVSATLVGTGSVYERVSTATSALDMLRSEAAALTAMSGASVSATTTSLSTLRTVTGTTSLSGALASVDAQRTALKPDATTLQNAVDAVSATLGGTGSVYERVSVATSDLSSLRAETAALTAMSGASVSATTSSLSSLRTVTGTTTLANALSFIDAQRLALKADATTLQGAVDAVSSTLGGTGSVFERASTLTSDLSSLRSETGALTAMSGASLSSTTTSLSTLRNVTGTTSLADALAFIDAQRLALKADAMTLASAITSIAATLGGSGSIYQRATTAMGTSAQCVAELSDATAAANALTAISGESLSATTTSVSTLRSVTGTTSLADALASIEAQRAALKVDAMTLEGAVTAIAATLGGSGSVFQRATTVMSTSAQCASELGDATAAANALTSVSGASLAATTTSLSTLRSVTGAMTLDQALQYLDEQRDALKPDAQSLGGAVSALASTLGGSGSIFARATAAMSDKSQCEAALTNLRSDVTSLTDVSGAGLTATTASISSLRAFTGATTLGDALSALDGQRAALKTDAATLSSAVAAVAATLGGSGSVYQRASAAVGNLGQCTTDLASLTSDVGALTAVTGAGLADTSTSASTLLTLTGTTTLAQAVSSVDAQRAALQTGAATLPAAVAAVEAKLGGSGTVFARADTARQMVDSSATDVTSGLTAALSATSTNTIAETTALVGTLTSERTSLLSASGASDVASLTSLLSSLSSCMLLGSSTFAQRALPLICNDHGMASLECFQGGSGGGAKLVEAPNGGWPTAFGPVVSDGMGGVSLQVAAGLGSANGTYTMFMAGPIANNAQFAMTSAGGNVLRFINVSGSTITSQSQLLLALKVYDSAFRTPNTCTGLDLASRRLGVAGFSLASKVSALTQQLDSSASTLDEAITTTSALVGATSAANDNNVFTSVDTFHNATDVRSQLESFVGLFDPANWANSSHTQLTQTTATPPTSLGGIISSTTSSSP